jgi:hypothetical protein
LRNVASRRPKQRRLLSHRTDAACDPKPPDW